LFEDFVVGDIYRSVVARTVTETDNVLFTMLAMNTNELHFNEEAARASEWGQVLVNSTFTLSVVLGLSVRDTTEAGGVNLGWKEIRLPKPVFIGARRCAQRAGVLLGARVGVASFVGRSRSAQSVASTSATRSSATSSARS
jgi:acyl dehydratase